MPDMFSVKKRSEIMSNIKSEDTLLERKGFPLLKKAGLNFRKHPKGISGKPDAANKKRKIAIFFDSDFWHGFEFKKWKRRLPSDYWKAKIQRNIERDGKINKDFKKEGWKVIRVWDHDFNYTEKFINKIKRAIR